MQLTKRWPVLEGRIERWWTSQRVSDYIADRWRAGSLIAQGGGLALLTACERDLLNGEALIATAQRVRRREFEILGSILPREGPWPWHADWRFDHAWPPAYFRSYSHYETGRPCPYDVKYPWELSRLGFVPLLMQAAALDPPGDWFDCATAILEDWARENPLAHAVTWDPMEASMRAIALVCALGMALTLTPELPLVDQLLRLLCAHGEFIWRTVEYSDVRGNHYTANLVALLLLGLSVQNAYPSAKSWTSHAASAIPPEIERQMLADGVNFEKSLSYHRLVTELFVMAMIAMERAGLPFPTRTRDRLNAACTYSAVCTRPDGLTPNVGDNDSARALLFDPSDPRDHRPLIGLGALLFQDRSLKSAVSRMPAAAAWLLGRTAISDWEKLGAERPPEVTHFSDGGVVVVRSGDGYLWFDVGEVGLAGRGGHGHNDLLSFELVVDGVPLVVDPGCPTYTADREQRNLFRSTGYHNTLRIDGQELAPMSGWWRIGNDALPSDIAVAWDGSRGSVHAAHGGYLRLDDPVSHKRGVTFSPRAGVFECTDILRCGGRHRVERHLHLSPDVAVTVGARSARLSCQGRAWSMRWDGPSTLSVENGVVSRNYGLAEPASILVLSDTIHGDTELRFSIVRNGAVT